jgi:hypothetical protein
MNPSTGARARRRRRTDAAQRAELLAAFDRSGVSAAAFTRQQGLNYTTLCGWRQRQEPRPPAPVFVQIELPPPTASTALVIELGPPARMRITDAGQIALAVRLLQGLQTPAPC